MFRHRGKTRTFKHNLRLAALLSFVAGLVNVTGFFLLKVLTTNVTGHFAFFAEELVRKNYLMAFGFLAFIASFLVGAFFSGLITEYFIRKGHKAAHKYSMSVEIIILLTIGLGGDHFLKNGIHYSVLACILLFAMGIQNSLVTQISNATVRTTHLTGLFTDLGIELSQLIFYRKYSEQMRLKKSIGLRFAIVIFFFLGCVLGGFLYSSLTAAVLVVASVLLMFALAYDIILFRYYKAMKKWNRQVK